MDNLPTSATLDLNNGVPLESNALENVPVETTEEDASPKDVKSPSSENSKNRMVILGVLLLIVICAGVGIGVGVGVSNNIHQQKQATSVQDSSHGNRTASLSQVLDYIATTGLSSKADLQKRGSPQSRAANWLANLDGLNMALPSDKNGSTKEGYKYLTRYTLGLLWFALDGVAWTNQFGFLSQEDFCYWNAPIPVLSATGINFVPGGVYCNRATKNVADLHLGECTRRIAAAADSEFTRPLLLAHSCTLSFVDLEYNKLKGTIPSELTKLTTMKLLALDGNVMSGSLGSNICQLKSLGSLTLAHNQLLGRVPSCLATLSDIKSIIFSSNKFKGKLPDLSKLTNLTSVLLDDNGFTGTVTTAFNQLTNLQFLILQGNSLQGKIDSNFLKNAQKLERLDLSNCSFSGQLSPHFWDMPKLELLDIQANRLSGFLPPVINENSALKYLSVNQNFIKGELPPSFLNLTALFHLDVSNNLMTGPIPARLGKALAYLFLANNNFTQGPISTLFGKLSNLNELSLKGTNRNGTIPSWVGRLTKLKLLDLDNNQLTGSVPTDLGLLTNLEFLLLNRNLGIKGIVPSQLNKLSNLSMVFLDRTSLSGDLAPLCKLSNLNTASNSGGARHDYVIAECGGSQPKVVCSCCDFCCSGTSTKCNNNTAVASVDPNWETSFSRVVYNFGTNDTIFKVPGRFNVV
jgi:Leucine-rich repeat (LRR) protein